MLSLSGLSMAQEEDEHSLEAKFAAAVKVIQSLPEEGLFQLSDDMMLMFYKYYRQATMGPCNSPRPLGFWDTRGKAEWDAWSSLGNMTKEEAMKNYVDHIQLILETIPVSEDVSELVEKLGDFYTEGEEVGWETDKRPFTRPFAEHKEELLQSIKKPKMEGYGDLWEDVQNLQQTDSSVHGPGGRPDWSPDRRFLMVDDKRWRSDPKGSSSSMEPSMSSLTNGTHSSLNSELEEEELAFNTYMHINGPVSDPSYAAPGKTHRPADSDNEEFCDSMEHLAMEESASKGLLSASGVASTSPNSLWFESYTTLKEPENIFLGDLGKHNSSLSRRGRGDSAKGSQSPKITSNPLRCVSVGASCSCLSTSRRPVGVTRGNVKEQIATALLGLQRDVADVLHRLHALEERTRSQSRSSSPRQEDSSSVSLKFRRPSWWPFDFSPLTVLLTTLWPLVTHWLVQLYLQRRRRKIP
ncbi:acyl-CoA-binding domain-containing protein 5-B isoform X3 [Nothobranchius furzeri]|uniref:Acyl-CoA-binding domain-containing protein 5 n=1 Tax=Nothobranchius furzeri TaxID=105023 RepID=A0A9D2YNJ2_NOTFU|nr:transcript variant X3 [Nothobranchius furzeri]